MKKSMLICSISLLSLYFFINIITPQKSEEYIKSGEVYGVIKKDCKGFDDFNMNKEVCIIERGSKAEILQDRNAEYYEVKIFDNKKVWIKAEDIEIEEEKPTNIVQLEDDVLEKYIKIKKITSQTKYFVWVDIDRQRTYIFENIKGNFKIIKRIICATGKNQSPTTRGLFEISDRGEWFYSKRLNSGAMYWLRFNNSYLFHSVAMNIDKKIIDPIVGEKRSSGCVRMKIDDIKWFYDNIPKGTKIFVN